MVRDGRASESPLAHLDGLNVKTDRRHDRRTLSVDELRWLLDVTENGRSMRDVNGELVKMPAVERFGMTAAARAMLYRVAVETGLRSAELRSLTRASFDLDGNEPSVTIAAAYAKNRRQDTLPLKPETASTLAVHLSGKMPKAQAFSMPIRTEVIRMFRADLTDARAAWIAEPAASQQRAERDKSTFLAEQDESGRYADFHALRHTFITGLVTGGVNPKVAQTLARHSVITLTMDRYTHLYQGNLSAALDVLPDLSQPTKQMQAATGTDAAPANAGDPRLARFLAHFDGGSGDRRSRGGLNQNASKDSKAARNHSETAGNSDVLTDFPASTMVMADSRRSGRAAECAGLESVFSRISRLNQISRYFSKISLFVGFFSHLSRPVMYVVRIVIHRNPVTNPV
jgi:integrase